MSIIKSTIQITFLSAFGIIITLVSQLVVAYYFGTSIQRDAYFIAIVIPNYISSVFVSSFGYIFLPKVVDLINNEKHKLINNFINSFLFLFVGVLTLVCVIGIWFSKNIIEFISIDLNHNQIVYTSKLLQILFPTILFTSLSGFISSLYQVNHSFIKPALASIFSTIIGLFFFIMFNNSFGIISLAWGTLLGSIGSFLLLLPVWIPYLKHIKISFKNPELIDVIKTSIPLLIIGVIVRFSVIIERSIASGLPQGSLSYLGYASQIVTALSAVTIGGLATTSYPVLSMAWSQNNLILVKNNIEKFIRICLIMTLFIATIFIVHGKLIVQIVFERGNFDNKATLAVSNLLTILMGFFIMSSLGAIIPKSFYIKGKTGITFIIGFVEILVFIILSYTLVKYYSYLGLAIAQFIGATFSIIFSILILHFTMVKLDLYGLFLFILKLFLSIFFCLIPIIILNEFNLQSLIYFILSVFLSLTFYLFFLIYIFKIEELIQVKNSLIQKFF